MTMIQLIHASRPFGFDNATLNCILSHARRCNARDNITGALVCRSDLYLQYLEGPAEAVHAAFDRIEQDNRRLKVTRLVDQPITQRLFLHWLMLDDTPRTWLWTDTEVANGALRRATVEETVGVFGRISSENA